MLTEMTRGVGLAAAISQSSSLALDQIQLVALPGHRVLMVVVTQDREVRNRVVKLDQVIPAEELASIRNYINRNFSRWTLENVRRELSARLDHASAAYDEILTKLTVLYSKGLLDIGPATEVHMEGASNLVGLDLHLTKEKMRELFRSRKRRSECSNCWIVSSTNWPASSPCTWGWAPCTRP